MCYWLFIKFDEGLTKFNQHFTLQPSNSVFVFSLFPLIPTKLIFLCNFQCHYTLSGKNLETIFPFLLGHIFSFDPSWNTKLTIKLDSTKMKKKKTKQMKKNSYSTKCNSIYIPQNFHHNHDATNGTPISRWEQGTRRVKNICSRISKGIFRICFVFYIRCVRHSSFYSFFFHLVCSFSSSGFVFKASKKTTSRATKKNLGQLSKRFTFYF